LGMVNEISVSPSGEIEIFKSCNPACVLETY
jgi:hypothetical protein